MFVTLDLRELELHLVWWLLRLIRENILRANISLFKLLPARQRAIYNNLIKLIREPDFVYLSYFFLLIHVDFYVLFYCPAILLSNSFIGSFFFKPTTSLPSINLFSHG